VHHLVVEHQFNGRPLSRSVQVGNFLLKVQDGHTRDDLLLIYLHDKDVIWIIIPEDQQTHRYLRTVEILGGHTTSILFDKFVFGQHLKKNNK